MDWRKHSKTRKGLRVNAQQMGSLWNPPAVVDSPPHTGPGKGVQWHVADSPDVSAPAHLMGRDTGRQEEALVSRNLLWPSLFGSRAGSGTQLHPCILAETSRLWRILRRAAVNRCQLLCTSQATQRDQKWGRKSGCGALVHA